MKGEEHSFHFLTWWSILGVLLAAGFLKVIGLHVILAVVLATVSVMFLCALWQLRHILKDRELPTYYQRGHHEGGMKRMVSEDDGENRRQFHRSVTDNLVPIDLYRKKCDIQIRGEIRDYSSGGLKISFPDVNSSFNIGEEMCLKDGRVLKVRWESGNFAGVELMDGTVEDLELGLAG